MEMSSMEWYESSKFPAREWYTQHFHLIKI